MNIIFAVILFLSAASLGHAEEAECQEAPRDTWISEGEIARIMHELGAQDYVLAVEDGCIEITFELDGQHYEASMDPVSGEILATVQSSEHRL